MREGGNKKGGGRRPRSKVSAWGRAGGRRGGGRWGESAEKQKETNQHTIMH